MSLTVELSIIKDIAALRKLFAESCKHHLQLKTMDATIITRAIFAQLTVPVASTDHPVFRRPEILFETAVVQREIMAAIFGTNFIPRYNGPLAGARREFAEICKALDQIGKSLDLDSATVPWQLFRAQIDVAADLATFQLLYTAAVAKSKEVLAAHLNAQIRRVCNELLAQMRGFVAAYRKIGRSGGENAFAAGRLKVEKSAAMVTFRHVGFEPLQISAVMYAKFQRLYTSDAAMLNDRMFIMCLRYSSLFGRSDKSFHAAAKPATFAALTASLGVTQELYAQPFNCNFDRFCSPFPDTDVFFGSVGRMQDFVNANLHTEPLSGSYEVGPPYTEEVMDSMIDQLMSVLRTTTEPLSFVVFVPDWRTPLQKCQRIMEDPANAFVRGQLSLEPLTYEYVDGVGAGEHIRFPFRTCIYVLQNDAGAERWPYSDAVAAAILESAASKK